MKEIKKYLKETLGVEIAIEPLKPKLQKNFPLFIRELYGFYKVRLFGRNIILLKNKNKGTATVAVLRKHLQIVEQTLDYPVVFVLPFLQAYNRKRLIQKQIAFIVPEKQMFIPQLLIDFREFGQTLPVEKEKLLPAAQCILLYHLLKENIELFALKTLAEKLNYTQATVTRAVQALVDRKIAEKTKENKEIRIRFKQKKYDLWKGALPVLQNPVKKVYPLKEPVNTDIVYNTSFNALAYYTNLAEDNKKYFAAADKDFQLLKKNKLIQIIQTDDSEIILEVWKYAPGLLTENRIVDPLSLYLTFKDTEDERVQMEMEKLINQLW